MPWHLILPKQIKLALLTWIHFTTTHEVQHLPNLFPFARSEHDHLPRYFVHLKVDPIKGHPVVDWCKMKIEILTPRVFGRAHIVANNKRSFVWAKGLHHGTFPNTVRRMADEGHRAAGRKIGDQHELHAMNVDFEESLVMDHMPCLGDEPHSKAYSNPTQKVVFSVRLLLTQPYTRMHSRRRTSGRASGWMSRAGLAGKGGRRGGGTDACGIS